MGRRAWLRAGLFAAAAAPVAWLAWAAARGGLGANPIETVTHTTGDAALRCLLATLAVTPLRRLAGWHALAAQRRMLGLFAFFYASLHFLTWSVLDLGLDLGAVVEDVAERPYVTVGFTAFLLLVPLAITSTRGWVRRLGRRWVVLHRLVYVSAGLVIVHYLWLVKADLRPPLAYGAVLAVLLAARLPGWRRAKGVRAHRAEASAASVASDPPSRARRRGANVSRV